MMPNSRMRSGMTLVEVMMALVIAMTALAIVMQTMMSMSSYVTLGQAQDDLALDAKNIFSEVSTDLSASGWYFPASGAPYSGVTFADDRALRYFPAVTQPAVGGLSGGQMSGFPELYRTAPFVSFQELSDGDFPGAVADAMCSPAVLNGMGAQRYRDSFYARSQELIFLRCTVNSWSAQGNLPLTNDSGLPSRIQRPIVNFGNQPAATWAASGNQDALGVLYTSGWTETSDGVGDWTPRVPGKPYGLVLEGARLDPLVSGSTGVILQWEEMGQISFQSQADENLRVFTYAVVPTPRGLGYGRLVRAFVAPVAGTPPQMGSEPGQAIAINGNLAVIVDTVLSNNVVRAVFETARHDPTLQMNQVRVRLYLARRAPTLGSSMLNVKVMVETTFTMRAKNSSVDQALDLPNIGAATQFTY